MRCVEQCLDPNGLVKRRQRKALAGMLHSRDPYIRQYAQEVDRAQPRIRDEIRRLFGGDDDDEGNGEPVWSDGVPVGEAEADDPGPSVSSAAGEVVVWSDGTTSMVPFDEDDDHPFDSDWDDYDLPF
jgi:hypothetical protein